MNQATQSLSPTGNIQRFARCPIHEKRSSEYLGPSEGQSGRVSWKFRCTALTQKGVRADHIFVARADPHAPTTAEESVAWLRIEREKKAGLQPTRSQS